MCQTRNCFWAAVLTILCVVPLNAEVEFQRAAEPLMVGTPNPTLAGANELHVSILPPDREPNKDGLVWAELDAKVQQKLKEAGLKLAPVLSLRGPELRIDVDMLKLAGSQQYAFRIQTSLAREVVLPTSHNLRLMADVWKTPPLMDTSPTETMPVKIADAVLGQVASFINCCLVANPSGAERADDAKTADNTKEKEDAAPAGAHRYIASKNSEVFHKPQCRWATRIAAKNLVGYKDRQEAIQAGKRPCSQCKP